MSPRYPSFVSYVLRLGLSFSYIAFAIYAYYTPETILLGASDIINIYHPAIQIILALFGVAMAIWIISGKRLFISASVSVLLLILLFAGNIQNIFVIFILLQILCSTLALIASYGVTSDIDTEVKNTEPPSVEKIPEIVKPIEPEDVVPTIH
mgnify:CR=1 FL=1